MPRTYRLPIVALLALLLSAGFIGAIAARAHASDTQVTIFEDDPNVMADPADTLNTIRSLGATVVRVFIPWSKIAPKPTSRSQPSKFNASDPGAYSAAAWAPYDAVAQAAAARGMGVYFDLTGPAPLWATPRPPRGTPNPALYEPNASKFGAFVKAVGTRYDGSYTPHGSSSPLPRVKFWAIWNEPNYGPDLQPQAIHGVEVSPRIYRGLLDAGWSGLSASGHLRDTILFGETAPRGANVPGIANGMVPLRFLRALYCVSSSFRQLRGSAATARGCPATAGASRRFRAQNPALFQATGFAGHLYTSGQQSRPNLASPSNEPDYAGLADLPKLERTLDRLTSAYGSRAKLPIYNTEFAFQTNPSKPWCGCVFLSQTTAAYYMNWSEYLMWRDARVRSYMQYLLYDSPEPGHPSYSDFSSGLLLLNGTRKADYEPFQLPLYLPVTSTKSGRKLEVWGDDRPGIFAKADTGTPQQVQIQFSPSSGGPFTTVSTVTITNSAGYFEVPVQFPGSGSVRLQWTFPGDFSFLPVGTPPTVTSRTQTITVS